MGLPSLQTLVLTFLVILYNGIGRSDAESAPLLVDGDGKFKVSQIRASGITDNNVLKRLQYDCCKSETGTASGLCLSSTGKPTIEIDFDYQTKVEELKLQTPEDISAGYIKSFKVMYKKTKADADYIDIPIPDFIWNIFPNDPRVAGSEYRIILDAVKQIIAEKLLIEIESFDGPQPCLRMEVMGCPEKECPVMWEAPVVEAVDSGNGDNTVKFQCSVKGRDQRSGKTPKVLHKATWIHDGKKRTKIPTGEVETDIVSILQQKDIYEYLPNATLTPNPDYKGGLKCSVTACGASGCKDWESQPKESNELLPTVTLDLGPGKTSVTIQQGQVGVDISFRLNGPPVLFLNYDYIKASGGTDVVVEARFTMRTVTPCKSSTSPRHDVVIENDCGHNITSGNWNDSHKLTLKAVTDGLYGAGVVTRKCNILMKHIDNTNKQTHAKKITKVPFDVHVIVADGWTTPVVAARLGTLCSIYRNYIRTFDRFQYTIQATGEFIMYRNKKYNYQVNVFFTRCNRPYGTCVCGVAVKAGDDVVIMNTCPTTSNPRSFFKIYVWRNGNLTPGLKVYYTYGYFFYVFLPTGTYVKVAGYRNYVEPVIVPSLSDLNQTEGLCGFYDGKRIGDLRNKDESLFTKVKIDYDRWRSWVRINDYAHEWRENIHQCDSMFFGVKANQSQVPVQTYCTCVLGSDSNDCGQHKDYFPCVPTWFTDITPKNGTTGPTRVPVELPNLSVCSNSTEERKKRSATYTPPAGEDDEYQSFVFDRSFVPKTVSWPTDSGWTEDTARKHCEDFILTKDALKNCKAFMGTTFEAEINSCVLDIQVSDSTDFVKSTLINILAQCLSEAEKYPATVTELPGGMNKVTLYESLCLDNCNNNGVCKDARCVCNPGFYGGTCSLTKDIPPNIVYVSRNGLCNTRTRNCTFSYVFGTGHIESTDLKCRMTPYNHRTGVRDLKGQFTSTAIYVNFNLLVCPHNNKNGTFLVAVSNNNGQDYSKDELLFLAYDSACHNCSSVDQDEKKANCTQETYGCAVGSACYLDGEVDEGNLCRICDTNRNIDYWSVNTAYSNCTTAPEDNIALIAGVSTAAVLVVAIIITVVLTLKFCGKAKSVSPPDIQEEAGRSESTADEPKPEKADNRKMSGVSINSITPSLTA